MTNALWFAFAIALGTLTADGIRAGTKALRWQYALWRGRRNTALYYAARQRNESAR